MLEFHENLSSVEMELAVDYQPFSLSLCRAGSYLSTLAHTKLAYSEVMSQHSKNSVISVRSFQFRLAEADTSKAFYPSPGLLDFASAATPIKQ
jgi:hypothetical protein